MDDRYYYRKYGDLFQLVENSSGLVLAEGPAVAIAFDIRNYTLLKHGMPKRVARWCKRACARYQAKGLIQEAADLTVVASTEWNVFELERILTIDGYLKLFCQHHDIIAGPRLESPPPADGVLVIPKQRRIGRLSCHLKPLEQLAIAGTRNRDRPKLRPYSRSGKSSRRSRGRPPALPPPPHPGLPLGLSLPR